jgi:type IV pilus assembly protein PilV
MIEALIAILIFSIAVLGLVGLQVSMSRSQTGSKFRADAAYLANDLVGTMWADATNLSAYLSTSCPGYANCKNWQDRLQTALPGSTYAIVPNTATGDVTITINWQMPNEGTHRFVTTTSINP